MADTTAPDLLTDEQIVSIYNGIAPAWHKGPAEMDIAFARDIEREVRAALEQQPLPVVGYVHRFGDLSPGGVSFSHLHDDKDDAIEAEKTCDFRGEVFPVVRLSDALAAAPAAAQPVLFISEEDARAVNSGTVHDVEAFAFPDELRTVALYTAAPAAAQAVPHGWKLVPVEPTPEMLNAAAAPLARGTGIGACAASRGRASKAYRAMLDAAPAPASEGERT